jgi:hypothetical protein
MTTATSTLAAEPRPSAEPERSSAQEAAPKPQKPREEEELRCTLCGLRACCTR